jgi:AcrR family transcriptional regulator
MARITTEERQSMIVDEAIKIIHKGGYQALSIRELAKNVNISEPAIYRHFLNKEDIILGILNRMIDFEHLLEKELSLKKTPQSRLKHFLLFHFEFLEKNKEMTSVLFSEEIFHKSKVLADKLKIVMKRRKAILNSIINEVKSQNLLIDIENEELIKILLGVIRISVVEWRLNNFSYSIVEKGKVSIKTIEKLFFIK